MVVDSSALIAILRNEASAPALQEKLLTADGVLLSAGNWLESAMVLSQRDGGATALNNLLQIYQIRISPVTTQVAELALDGFLRYGKGRHPAALNFGDCFSYGLAKFHHAPLLFSGQDFAQTDVIAA